MILLYDWLMAIPAIRRMVLCILLSIVLGNIKAQVQGTVQTASGDPVPYASVAVHQESGAGVKELVADSAGIFILPAVADGAYQLIASGTGYHSKTGPLFRITGNTLSSGPLIVVLEENRQQLRTVLIRSKRRTIEQSIDKMTLNVENSMLSEGNTALELLERAPGVKVDEAGKISLRGKPGVTVMLNGKRTYLSASELATLLKATTAASVSKIEIMANPTAKYDAAGNAGIINIVMKKNTQQGLNGSVTANGGAGRKARYGAGFNLNYRTEKFNIYSNYNYGFRGETEYLDFVRHFYEEDRLARTSVQRTETDEPLHTQNFSMGVDFTPDSLSSMGILVTGNTGHYRHNSQTSNQLTGSDLLTRTITDNKDRQYWSSFTYNLNYKRRFAKKERELTLDLDFVPNRFRSDLTLDTYTQPNSGLPEGRLEQRKGRIPSKTDVYVAKADYTDAINEKIKWELGVKSSFIEANNNLKYYNRQDEAWQYDAAASNHFKYKEQIHAGYLNGIFDLGRTSLQAGIRGELTKTTGNQLITGQVFNRNYFQIFPTLAIGRKISDAHQLQLTYGRRIERPNYDLLNPFRLFRDPSLYYEGNPYLKPELTQNITLNHVLKNRYTTSLYYSRTTDVITWMTGQSDATNTTYEQPQNLQALINYGVSITAQLNYTSWWSATNFANIFRNEYHLPDSKNSRISFSANAQNTFTLGKGYSAEFTGTYYSRAVYGILTEKGYYILSAAFQKTVLKEKGRLKLQVNDLFQSQNFRNETRYQNIDMNSKIGLDSRRAILSFTYRFGMQQSGIRRKTGSEDIQSRIR